MSRTIIDLFDTQVSTKPHETALISDGKELTYSQLNDSINQTVDEIKLDQLVKENGKNCRN